MNPIMQAFAAIADGPATAPALPAAQPVPAAPNATAEPGSLASRAMLVDFDKRMWGATKTDKEVSAEVARQHGASQDAGRYVKNLVPEKTPSLLKLRQIGNAAEAEHRARTLAWGERKGLRILSSTGYLDYCAAMRRWQDTWNAAVDDFCADYARILAGEATRLNGLFKASDYPSATGVRALFSLGYTVDALPTAADFRCDLPDFEVARIRAEIEAREAAEQAAYRREVAERIRVEVGHMAERLRAYTVTKDGATGVFRDSLVDNVRHLAGLVPALNVTNDPDLARIGEEMARDLLAYSPAELRANPDVRAETAAAADAILAQVAAFAA